MDKHNFKEDRIICRNCYNIKERSKKVNIVPEKRNNDKNASFSAHEYQRNVIIGPGNSGKNILHVKKILKNKQKNLFL